MMDKDILEIPNLNSINKNYNKIIENYKNYNKNIRNINDDIKNLENIHNVYINSGDMSSINYSVYVDDIKHQINITRIEHTHINDIYLLNLEKLYRDLFKLYTRITKLLLNIFRENKETIVKIWKSNDKFAYDSNNFKKFKKNIKILSDNSRTTNPLINDNKIFDEIKKQYFSDITIYNELKKDYKYDTADIIKIYENLTKRFEDLILSRELIELNLIDIQSKTEKGIFGQTFIMDLHGKSNRIKVDYCIMVKLLESTINMHLGLSNRYYTTSQMIADQVSCDDTTVEVVSDNADNGDIFISADDITK
jgi:hypothetical protein